LGHKQPITTKAEGAILNEKSVTIIPCARIQPQHIESGVDPLSFAEEFKQAAESAAKQSTKKDNKHE